MNRRPVPEATDTAIGSRRTPSTAKWLSEFIYGVITAMVALAAFAEHPEGTTGYAVALTVVGGASAIWLAHAFSELVGERAVTRHSFGFAEVGRFLRQSWPIVVAGFLIAAPILLSEAGLWPLARGITLGNVLGLVSLGVIGVAIGVVDGSRPIVIAWDATFAVGIGALIILLESAVHRLG